MAEAILSGLFETIRGNLTTLILHEANSAWSYKKDLTNLKSTLATIQAVLRDAEEQQIRSAAMRNWLTKLKDAAYDADDLLDNYATEVRARSLKFQLCYSLLLLNPLGYRFRMARRIKEITERLDGVAAERSKFHLKDGMLEERPDSGDRYQTHSFVMESNIFGREEDKCNIVELLLDVDGETTISIVGMGGIGKTTVAQLVYHDEKVTTHFDLRLWVCISENIDLTRLVQGTVESVPGKKCKDISMNEMIIELTMTLEGKRFLLVLDGVWSEDYEMWSRFKAVILKCTGATGSKVILTTRSEKVARIFSYVNIYQLGVLSDHDCWSLFKQHAFAMGRKEEPNLVTIGKEIVKKCGGLPLAAKALGGMMRFKYEENQWLSIKESEIWNLTDDENVILPALRLSYSHLPSHLKQCFAYCSIFPKGYEIDKDELILLWIANDFVPTKRKMTLEDVGNEIFSDLLMRSFFQDIQQIENGKITKCKMHCLMSDLAQAIMRNECSIIQVNNTSFDIERIRHVCCDVRPLIDIPSSLYRAESMRTFLLLSPKAGYISSRTSPDIGKFRCLRVLVLSHTYTMSLPIPIANLKHVRYLDLSYTLICSLPEPFNTLQNLQTFLLECCSSLQTLPEGLSDISSLRHININECISLSHMPMQFGKLTCLQTLTDFIVGKNKGSHIGELQGLDLRGELHIRQLQNVSSEIDAGYANLAYKGNIQSLWLSWEKEYRVDTGKNADEVLAALQPHENLKIFQLEGYWGIEIPSWMKSSSLPNLVEISIVKCRNIKHLPDLGKLPFLKVLFIKGMDALKKINSELYGDDMSRVPFPSLKEFTLEDLPNLEEWLSWDEKELFPCLAKLIIRKCPKLRTMPHIPSLQNMVLKESNELLLSSVENFTSLSSLHVGGFPEKSLPQGMLQNLKLLQSFKLKDCPKLSSLPMELENQLLTSKTIWNCPALTSVTEDSRLEHSSVVENPKAFQASTILSRGAQKIDDEDLHRRAYVSHLEAYLWRFASSHLLLLRPLI